MTIDQVITDHNNMIWKLAIYFHKKNYHIEVEDFAQVGLLALYKAFMNYDSSRGTKIGTIIHKYSYREMLHYAMKNRPLTECVREEREFSFEEYLPDYLSNEEKEFALLKRDGNTKTEICKILNISPADYNKLKDSTFSKIKKANEKNPRS